jgi:NAD(P)-dependent dehydrogenase (short-subunit alcohol dehydrogenase family)
VSGTSSSAHRLAGKAAFVTGASRGIGEAIGKRLAAEGARVVFVARDRDACEKHAAEVRAAGGEAIALTCDVTDAGSVEWAIAEAVARFGAIHVLVNNAGLGGPTPLDDKDDSRWDAILATNLTGMFRVTREAAPRIPDGGRVVNMSSVLGRFGVAGLAAYCATKHGVIGLTRAWALELAPRKITVNAICPGWVETEMARSGWRRIASGDVDKGRDAAARMAPLGVVLEPEEIAGLVAYLASDDARSITGQAIVADGGQVMP